MSNGYYNEKSHEGYYNEKQDPLDYYSSHGHSLENDYVPSYSSHEPLQKPPKLGLFVTPPKAAFVEPPPPSPVVAQAVNFGDAPTRRPQKVKTGSIDWSRFSVMLHKQESAKEKDSQWAKKETSKSRKWTILGWIGVIIIIAGIAALLYWHFSTSDGKVTEPTIPSLGGFNGGSVTDSSTTSSSASATGERINTTTATHVSATSTGATRALVTARVKRHFSQAVKPDSPHFRPV